MTFLDCNLLNLGKKWKIEQIINVYRIGFTVKDYFSFSLIWL